MNLHPALLTIVQNASVGNMTSSATRLVLSYTKGADGSDIRTYTPGATFACNIQPLKGSEVPLPLANLDVGLFKVFVPASTTILAQDQIQIDGNTYVVEDIDDRRSATQISRRLIVSGIHT